MAKDDAIEIDALLNPTLGDTRKVAKELEAALARASKPLVDTISNVKVGLNSNQLAKAQKQMDELASRFGAQFESATRKVLDDSNKEFRNARGLRSLARADKDVAALVRTLGGYDEAAAILNRPDASRRLNAMTQSFQRLSDSAFQLSRLPAIDDKVQRQLKKLYESNNVGSFRKMSEAQQRQVRDALAIVDLQNEALRNVRTGMARAGMGTQAARIAATMGERRDIAQRLTRITSPQALASAARSESLRQERIAAQQQRLIESEARSRAVSMEKDRVLRRTGGITGLASAQDISAVRAGLNRDYNYAAQQASLAAAGRGGRNSQAYREAVANVESIKAQRTALDQHTQTLRNNAKAQESHNKSMLRAQEQQMVAQAKWQAQQQKQFERESQLRTRTARNSQQARDIYRRAGGDLGELDRDQLRVMRPYLQDRFRSRTQYAEGIGRQYGTDSPEFARASQSARQYAQALGELDDRARALRPSMTDLGHIVHGFIRYALGYGALYQLLGGVVALGRGLADLDEQLHNIQAITLSTDQQMRTIDGAIKQVGLTTKFTLNEIAQGAQILAQAGSAPEVIPQQLKATADFAAATNTSISDAADLLTSFQNVYTDLSSGRAADLLTKALNLSKLQGTDLRTIISYTAQTAEGYNIAADHLLGAVATLRNVGIRPSTVATGLRQAMLEIFSPDAKLTKALSKRYADMGEALSDEAIQARFNAFTFTDNPLLSAVSELRRIGFGGEASNLFSRAFDVRAFNPLQALVKNFETFSQLTAQVNVGQSAIVASGVQMESLRATLENLGAATVVFADSVGGGMVRSLQAAASSVTDLIQELTKLDQTMKMETGSGLGSVIGWGAAGGLAGSVLAGRGNRLGGFAAGAFAGGSLAGQGEDSKLLDSALPLLAGLLTVIPSLTDFLGGMGRRKADIQSMAGKARALNAAKLTTAAGMGAGLVDMFTSIGDLKLPSGSEGWKSAGKGMLAAAPRLLLRAIPVVGAIWTVFELLQLLSGSAASRLQQEAERARTRAIAAGDQYRSLHGERETGLSRVEEFQIDAFGNAAAENTTAATAARLQRQATELNLSMVNALGMSARELGEAADLVEKYASRDSDQRKEDLARLEAITGRQLTDRQVYDLSSSMRELQTGVEGYRSELLHELNRQNDLLQKAIIDNDAEGIEQATAMQRVIDELPELRRILHGESTASAEEAAELFIQFNRRMAEELEKGVVSSGKVLEARIKMVQAEITAISTTLGDSSQMDTAIRQIITALELTETNVAEALEGLAESTRSRAQKLRDEAAQLIAKANQAEISASRGPAPLIGGGSSANWRSSAADRTRAGELSAEASAQERAAQLSEDRAKLARDRAAVELAEVTKRTAETMSRVQKAMADGTFSEEFLRERTAGQVATLQQVADPTQFAALQRTGALDPVQGRGGQWQPSPVVAQLDAMLQAEQQHRNTQAELSAQKQREALKAQYLSSPETMVEVARLENQRRAAERRNQYGEAQNLTRRINELQYAEQEKAVGRARIDMEAAEDADKRDATAAIERYNSELAKLESMRGQMADKLDEYQRKIVEMDQKRETVSTEQEKRRVQAEFNEAIGRGDYQAAKEASDAYIDVQQRLQALAEREMELKGHTPEQIQLEMKLRDDLTKTLIDQEGAQRRLTSAILARSEFRTREAGRGPTTGNLAVDAFTRASGVGFTDAQYAEAYTRDLQIYVKEFQELEAQRRRQLADLTGEDARVADREFTERLEMIQGKIGETAAQLKQLQNLFTDELSEAFNATAFLSELQAAPTSLQNYGEAVRQHMVTAVDDLGQAIADVLRKTESWDDALKGVIHTLANNIFEQTTKMGVNWLFQQGAGMLASDEDQGSGLGGIMSGIGNMITGGAGGGTTGTMSVQAGSVTVNAATETGGVLDTVGEKASGLFDGMKGESGSVFDGMKEKAGNLFGGMNSLASGLFDSLKGGFGDLIGGLGSMLAGLLGGGGGGSGGGWMGMLAGAAGSYFGGPAGGAAASGTAGSFRSGGMPSRAINGKRSVQRDNLLATATIGGKTRPIKVEAGEGILSRSAMALVGGEAGLNALNRGKLPGFAFGGTPQNAQTPAQFPLIEGMMSTMKETASGSQPEQSINIANVYSTEEFQNFIQSRTGLKVIVNELKRNGYL